MSTLEKVNESQENLAPAEGHKEISSVDYSSMDLEGLFEQLKKKVKSDSVRDVKDEIALIKKAFDRVYEQRAELKKAEFIKEGGTEFDFSYELPIKHQFEKTYSDFKKRLRQHYKDLENTLNENLQKKLDIVKKIKELVSAEESVGATFRVFMDLQREWRQTGPVPKTNSEDIWQNYQHHVERFYDYLELNRDLRDKDFAHNLEQKEQVIAQLEALASEADVVKAFREATALTIRWYEELGPVHKDLREDVWKRFNNALHVVRQRKKEYLDQLQASYQQNGVLKTAILDQMQNALRDGFQNIQQWKKKKEALEELRQSFLKIDKAPENINKALWERFRETMSSFHKQTKAFFHDIKNEQRNNLHKRKELINLVARLTDEPLTAENRELVVQAQKDWKATGHVGKKEEDKSWSKFKELCNAYFDKIHQKDHQAKEDQITQSNKEKEALLEVLKAFAPLQTPEENMTFLQEVFSKWKNFGHFHDARQKALDERFEAAVADILKVLNIEKEDLEILKYENKIAHLQSDNSLFREREALVKHLSELNASLKQLENNVLFINTNRNNPLLKNINQQIAQLQEKISLAKEKKKVIDITIRKHKSAQSQ